MMKKIFLVILTFFCLFLNLISLNSNSPDIVQLPDMLQSATSKKGYFQEQSKFQRLASTLSEVPEKLLKASEKINIAFNCVSDRIDMILTKKGAIKTLIILGPLFVAYCYFFPPDPVKALINRIVSSAAQGASEIVISTVKGIRNNDNDVKLALKEITRELGEFQGIYNVNYEIGQTGGLWQGLWDSPFSTIGLLTSKGIQMAMITGVPFISGILANNWLKRTP